MNRLTSNIDLWKRHFPAIKPYYAIKCNSHPTIISTLSSHGCSFDCASLGEIKKILNICGESKGIIFANPIKMQSHLRYADKFGIKMMTADCAEELEKIGQYHKNAEILLRIAVDDSQSLCKFNSKFGLTPENKNLEHFFDTFIKSSNTYPIKLTGVSFHVGSGCKSESSYCDAIEKSRYVFEFAKKYGIKMNVLDLGGGFVQKEPLLSKVSTAINNTLETWKSKNSSYPTKVIAEPGRFMAANVFDLYVKIIGKKKESNVIKYYVNDGVYGSFNCKIFDHAQFDFDLYKKTKSVVPNILEKVNGKWNQVSYESTIFGATCDSIDVIIEKVKMPELEIGDYMRFNEMGAYTSAAASSFNGIPQALIWIEK